MAFLRIPFLILITTTFAFSQHTHWHKAIIHLEGKGITEIQKLGIALDHGKVLENKDFLSDFPDHELELIQAAGFKIEIVPDQEISVESRVRPYSCDPNSESGAPIYNMPHNYEFGSLGGFLNYQEMLDNLDLMHELYPNLISSRKAVSATKTYKGKNIYYLKISDNPDSEETEPEVLYTALHHAREPLGMSQMLYFMWYLLENYESNPAIKSLVDSRQLFFVPCLNPDGYLENERTDPSGGGYWRKNMNPNQDGIGTDLNRNYGIGYAFDNNGSSNDGTNETYRGKFEFSEAETRALREFCINRNFIVALNYHTFGDLLIIPWGYLDRPTADSTQFISAAKEFIKYNNFSIGTSQAVLGYAVNGTSDDWMYGEQRLKNKIFAFTPEVGQKFWPERKDIISLNQSTQYMNIAAAWISGAYAKVKEISAYNIQSQHASKLICELNRLGIADAAIECTVSCDYPGLKFDKTNYTLNLNAAETKSFDIPYSFEAEPVRGQILNFTIQLKTGDYSTEIKFKKVFTTEALWSEVFNDFGAWYSKNNSPWNIVNKTFVSAPSALSTATDIDWIRGTEQTFQTLDPIDIRTAAEAYLGFNAKWDVDNETDFVQIRISTDGINFEPLCGIYTKQGNQFQDTGNPIYSGSQNNWIAEWMDLKKYIGQKVYIQLYSNSTLTQTEHSGFFIDDINVYTKYFTKNDDAILANHIHVLPNPAHDKVEIISGLINSRVTQVEVYDIQGKSHVIPTTKRNNSIELNTSTLEQGIYHLTIYFDNQKPIIKKFVIE